MEISNVIIELPTHSSAECTLLVRGEMTQEIEEALNSVPFDFLTVVGDRILKGLSPYAAKIKHISLLSVDSYAGLESLKSLQRLHWRDVRKNTFDFRLLPKLATFRNDNADMTHVSFFNIPSLEKLSLWSVKAKDLTFLSDCHRLRILCFRRGSTNSLFGLDNLTALRTGPIRTAKTQ